MMRRTSGKTRSSSAKPAAVEPPSKKQKGIDMSKVPASLLQEGWDEEFDDDDTATPTTSSTTATTTSNNNNDTSTSAQNAMNKKTQIPDYLNCPMCKELLIEPEIYSCGHTLCKVCIESSRKRFIHTPYSSGHSRECPICKSPCCHSSPNLILRELIEAQFPEQHKKRAIVLKESQELVEKLNSYPHSKRFQTLNLHLEDLFETRWIASVEQVVKHLSSLPTSAINPTPSGDEIHYFIACKVMSSFRLREIGNHILSVRGEVTEFLNWMDKNGGSGGSQKKTSSLIREHVKWSPLIIFAITTTTTQENYQRMANLFRIDIGDKIPLEEWKLRPPFWLKNLDIGEIEARYTHPIRVGTFHGMSFDESDEDSDDYNSSDWD